jgi:hypothetical protein
MTYWEFAWPIYAGWALVVGLFSLPSMHFHVCFHREGLLCRPFVMRGPGFWLVHVGPLEVSNRPIF